MRIAFEQVRKTHADQITGDVDVLSFAWELLYAACDKFDEAIALGKSEAEAQKEADEVFTSKTVLS